VLLIKSWATDWATKSGEVFSECNLNVLAGSFEFSSGTIVPVRRRAPAMAKPSEFQRSFERSGCG
jgi:hypothetical protein